MLNPFKLFTKKENTKELGKINDTCIIFKESKPIKLPSLHFDGYIIYEKQPNSNQYELLKVGNLKDVYKVKEKAYLLHDYIGTLNKKPLLFIKNNIPLSCKFTAKSNIKNDKDKPYKNGIDLCYDAKLFYTLLNYVNISNLSAKNDAMDNIFDFLSKNFLFIAILIIAILLLLTPIGQKLLSEQLGIALS